ncbi:MAG: L-2-hydroxyglutarate oxidase [Woeseia sp.]|nr:L-2-hydroxyglutarate oxidase [Woeseia sp.]|tara:strand:+ start:263 stop:1420 length:1158 start_codon:yes stop_codon:yes gene_type:complete
MHLQKMDSNLSIVVLEKDSTICGQQSGHNSNVLHAGIYYEPGSMKARFCVDGNRELAALCGEFGLPIVRCGKVIVANTNQEIQRLENLLSRGTSNGVPGLRILTKTELKEVEPNVRGEKALYAPHSAVVDYRKIANVYAEIFEGGGGQLLLNTEFLSASVADDGQKVATSEGLLTAKLVINCGGLQSDLIAKKMGSKPNIQIIPFRGEYYVFRPESRNLVNGLVYPVPDPSLPFLDVHLTPQVDGSVEAGPNAVLATMREGYAWKNFSARDFWQTLSYPGFWNLARKNLRAGVSEINRSLRKRIFVESLQKLVPVITADDLERGGAGVRAMAVDRRGNLVDDFYIEEEPGAIHVLNAPSPAATSSYMIGKHLAHKADANIKNARL